MRCSTLLAVTLISIFILQITGQELQFRSEDNINTDSSYSYSDGYDDYDDQYFDSQDDYNDQDDEYDESNYQYTDDEYANHDDYMDVNGSDAGPQPVFTTDSTRELVDLGNTARITCGLRNLGDRVIFWKKEQDEGEPKIISMDDHTYNDDRIHVEVGEGTSTLTISLVQNEDTGVYLCEVSTTPPLIQEHIIEIRSAATVQIQQYQEELVLTEREPLQLECKGFGDPMPSIYWYRENKLLPDGLNRFDGSRLVYNNVSGKHSGTYTCSGDNGFGRPSTQSIHVTVLYAPALIFNHQTVGNNVLLTCVVEGYPEVTVSWSKDGGPLPESAQASGEGGKHVLTLPANSKDVMGVYKCLAKNTVGNAEAQIDLTGVIEENIENGSKEDKKESDEFLRDTVKSVDELFESESAEPLEHNTATTNILHFFTHAIIFIHFLQIFNI